MLVSSYGEGESGAYELTIERIADPLRSDVERFRAYYAVAGDLRALGDEVVRPIATRRESVIDIACDACPAIDDQSFSARLAALRRAAADVDPDSLSIERFESPAFKLVVVEYMTTGDVESAFTLLFASRTGGPWRPIYGWRRIEETYRFVFGAVDGFVAGADALVRLSVSSRDFGSWEAIVDLDGRTLRVVP